MIKNAKYYKGHYLIPGSLAKQLHYEGRFKELDQLLARLSREEDQRQGKKQ